VACSGETTNSVQTGRGGSALLFLSIGGGFRLFMVVMVSFIFYRSAVVKLLIPSFRVL
jgi:hypothetical protein